jgi:DNA-binding transcriptional MerR regulator
MAMRADYKTIIVWFTSLEKIQQIIRDNQRVRELDEELLVAKEVSVRLHGELEKSEQARSLIEKLNISLKQNLDTLKESLNDKLSQVDLAELLTAFRCSTCFSL